jgi:hypothetical protein
MPPSTHRDPPRAVAGSPAAPHHQPLAGPELECPPAILTSRPGLSSSVPRLQNPRTPGQQPADRHLRDPTGHVLKQDSLSRHRRHHVRGVGETDLVASSAPTRTEHAHPASLADTTIDDPLRTVEVRSATNPPRRAPSRAASPVSDRRGHHDRARTAPPGPGNHPTTGVRPLLRPRRCGRHRPSQEARPCPRRPGPAHARAGLTPLPDHGQGRRPGRDHRRRPPCR